MVPIAYNIRGLMERRRTTMATAFGIAMVVFVLSASMMLSRGIETAMGLAGSSDVAIVLRKGSDSELGSTISTEQVGLVASTAGVKRDREGSPLAVGELIVVAAIPKIGAEDQISNVQIRGVPENVFEFRSEVRIVDGRPPKPGTDEAVIGKRLRGRFVGVDLNQEFELKKNRAAKVVGVFEAGGSSHESEVWVDVETLRTAFGRDGIVSSVRVKLEAPDRFEAFRDTLEHDKRLGLVTYREAKFLEMQSEGTAIFVTALGTGVSVFFSMAAILGAMITMFAAVAQRRREIGVLRALGFSRFSILTSFMFESLILALVGGSLGALAAVGMGSVEFSLMNFATWSEMIFKFQPTANILVFSLMFSVFMGMIGGLLPALEASRISPAEAMRN